MSKTKTNIEKNTNTKPMLQNPQVYTNIIDKDEIMKIDTSCALIIPNVSEKVKSPIKGSAETKEGDASDGMPTKI